MTVTTSVGVSGDLKAQGHSASQSCENVQEFGFTVGNGVTDKLVNLAIDVSQLTFLVIHTDQDLTLKTNAPAGGAQETITLKANNPLYFSRNAGLPTTVLFAGDVTATYWSNGGATTANVTIKMGLDATP